MGKAMNIAEAHLLFRCANLPKGRRRIITKATGPATRAAAFGILRVPSHPVPFPRTGKEDDACYDGS